MTEVGTCLFFAQELVKRRLQEHEKGSIIEIKLEKHTNYSADIEMKSVKML